MTDSLLVNEIFLSLQGEGSFVGKPAVFVRLQGCSVGCPWCDTAYAQVVDPLWRWPDNSPNIFCKSTPSSYYTCVQTQWLLKEIITMYDKPGLHIVLTGGEPCRQQIKALTESLLEFGFSVQVETSGTEQIACAKGTWITLSPKCKPVLEENWAKADEIKLPVFNATDIERYIKKLEALPQQKILLQPISLDEKATQFCIQECLKHNWRLSIQMHKYVKIR